MDGTVTGRERRVLADVGRDLAADHGLDRRLRAGRPGIRGLWYRTVAVDVVLAAACLSAIALGVAAARTRPQRPGADLCGAVGGGGTVPGPKPGTASVQLPAPILASPARRRRRRRSAGCHRA